MHPFTETRGQVFSC